MLSFRAEIPTNRFEGLKTQSLLTRVVQEKQLELAKNKPKAELSGIEQTGENAASAKILFFRNKEWGRFFRSKQFGRFFAEQLYSGMNKNGTQHRSGILLRFKNGREMILKRAFFGKKALLERKGQERYPLVPTLKLLKARLNAH